MRRRSGVALVVVLWTVVLLATVTAVASSAARGSAQVAANGRALATARAMAESGIVAVTAFIDDSLVALASDSTRRDAFLSRLEPQLALPQPLMQDTLADGVLAVTVVDVSARLDVNETSVDGLETVFRTVMATDNARRAAVSVVSRVRGEPPPHGSSVSAQSRDAQARAARDSLGAALLGQASSPRYRRPFESLDELFELLQRSGGVDERAFAELAPLLTVDGDGRINQRAASSLVRAAATGTLIDRPARLLCIARGWEKGSTVTREIQALYEVAEDGLRLVRWRETSK